MKAIDLNRWCEKRKVHVSITLHKGGFSVTVVDDVEDALPWITSVTKTCDDLLAAIEASILAWDQYQPHEDQPFYQKASGGRA
jgi:hypothetical protein